MTFTAAILALTVVFPKPGTRLPALDRCYMIGAVEPGSTNLMVNGVKASVHELGGYVTMLDLVEGENQVEVKDDNGTVVTNFTLTVAAKPKVKLADAAAGRKPPKPYEKLKYSSDVPRSDRTGRIYIDAGHGGQDPGTLSPHALAEKEVNLLVAKAVAAELERSGVETSLTRTEDVSVELYDRPKAAHADRKSAAFVSIHHNAPPYHRDPRELRYHAVYAWNKIGEDLASPINRAMAEAFGNFPVNNGVIHANYAVTRSNEVPSCLIEVDFITSPQGEIDCWNRDRIQKTAAAIAKGIMAWRNASH